MLSLASRDPDQHELEWKFVQLQKYFRYCHDITLDNGKAYYNAKRLYQIKWWLLGDYGKILGTLVFGTKLPTVGFPSVLRKFWVRRNNNAKFGDVAASVLINTELFDSLYCHDHDESLRLNQYSQGDGDVVYRHESVDNKNPTWCYVSPEFSEQISEY